MGDTNRFENPLACLSSNVWRIWINLSKSPTAGSLPYLTQSAEQRMTEYVIFITKKTKSTW